MIQDRFATQLQALNYRLTGQEPGPTRKAPDVNDQAHRLADLVVDLRAENPDAQELVSQFWSHSLAQGKHVTWEMPANEQRKLTPDSRKVLEEALVDVRLEGVPKVDHQKVAIVDGQAWFLSDPKR